ncbi:MAG: class I SAM-dependent methyltransferase [Alphaproteobacteria bacterium]
MKMKAMGATAAATKPTAGSGTSPEHRQAPLCRSCGARLKTSFIDLGFMPPSNAYRTIDDLNRAEMYLPLRSWVCDACLMVQLEDFSTPEAIFSDYAYFSSYSDSWLRHARAFAETVSRRFELDARTRVVEIASNDGYLLQYFQARNVPVLGIEPARNVARVAEVKGIPTRSVFFGEATATALTDEGLKADLLVANNVLAHVPDINDFVAGAKRILKQAGVWTIEFPHLVNLLEETQFDTIYHEHFSYLSLASVAPLMARHGLTVFDVEQLPTHGGSLRLYIQHADGPHVTSVNVARLNVEESAAGIDTLDTYRAFGPRVARIKRDLLTFLIEQQAAGVSVAAYGAPAKGNTLLNHCGITPDLLPFTVDRSIAKQQHFMPGSHIPIYGPEAIAEHKPDYVLILPWNLRGEIMEQMTDIRSWGGRFVTAIPDLKIWP